MSLNKAANWLRKKYPRYYESRSDAKRMLVFIFSASDRDRPRGFSFPFHITFEGLPGTYFRINGEKRFSFAPSDIEEIKTMRMQLSLQRS